jgi:hypothetical protein
MAIGFTKLRKISRPIQLCQQIAQALRNDFAIALAHEFVAVEKSSVYRAARRGTARNPVLCVRHRTNS